MADRNRTAAQPSEANFSQPFYSRALDDLRQMNFPGRAGFILWALTFVILSAAFAPGAEASLEKRVLFGVGGFFIGLIAWCILFLLLAIWRQRCEARREVLRYRQCDIKFVEALPLYNPSWSVDPDDPECADDPIWSETETVDSHTMVWRARVQNTCNHRIEGLNANIEFYEAGMDAPRVKVWQPRWANNPANLRDPNDTPLEIDLAPGGVASLVVAMKRRIDQSCYGFANESLFFQTRCNPAWELPAALYRVKVEFAGDGLYGRDVLWFELRNRGSGKFFDVAEIGPAS